MAAAAAAALRSRLFLAIKCIVIVNAANAHASEAVDVATKHFPPSRGRWRHSGATCYTGGRGEILRKEHMCREQIAGCSNVVGVIGSDAGRASSLLASRFAAATAAASSYVFCKSATNVLDGWRMS